MRKVLLGCMFVFVGVGTLQAQTVVKIASSFEAPNTAPIAWPASFTFVQRIAAKQKGSISEVGVVMGNGLTPYAAALTIDIGTTRVFAQNFTGLTQRASDNATVFPIKGVSQIVKVGDVVTVSIAPAADVQMAPITFDHPDFPRGAFAGSDPVALKFFVNGVAPVTVTAGPPSGGRITGGGLNCGGGSSVCSAEAAYGSTVTFSASNTSGEYMFKQWNYGPCSGSSSSNCTVVAAGNISLAAWFVAASM
jgi:hypothetical protein